MIEWIIRWSVRNRLLVLMLTAFVTAGGMYALRETPIDALPDLSDVQVIVKTSFPGQAPQVVDLVEQPRRVDRAAPLRFLEIDEVGVCRQHVAVQRVGHA